jgi:uncharacterized spore protein YtfJ
MADKTGARQRQFRIETIRGEPMQVREHNLTPVARVVSFGRARATIGRARGTIGSDRVSGWGGGFWRITPLALIEDTPEGERCVGVSNATSTALASLLRMALAVTVFFAAIRWLVRHSHESRSPLLPA